MVSRAFIHSLRSRFAATRERKPVRSLNAVCAAGLLALLVGGCNDDAAPPATAEKKEAAPKEATKTLSTAEYRCQQLLNNGLDMLKPESLGITSQEQQVVDAFNGWASECGKTPAPASDPAAANAKSGSGSEAFADLYDQIDIEHIRNCWLIRQLGAGTMRTEATDLDRAVGLFELANQTIELLPAAADAPMPLSPYDIIVIGRGTAEDRAWIFGELLRQAGIDSVIIRPKSSGPASGPAPAAPAPPAAGGAATKPAGAAPRWLVGVLLDKQVYLFDPTLGWPIPGPDDQGTTVSVRQPATLAQVVAHDELLRKLDPSPEHKYPLKASDLKAVSVELITSSRYSEPRMKRIEAYLAGDRSTSAYAPVGDVGGRPGLRSRVENAGGGAWKKEDVSLWSYPDQQIAGAHHLEGAAKKQHDADWLPFQGPLEIEFDSASMEFKVLQGTTYTDLKGNPTTRKQGVGAVPMPGQENERVEVRHDQQKQIKARIAQLQGDPATAIRKYLMVQLEELPPQIVLPKEIQERALQLPPEKRPQMPVRLAPPKREFIMNFRAAEDAKFWMGVCQMQTNELETAEETFNAYLRRYTQNSIGSWIMQAAWLRSLCFAQNKKFALAVQAIDQLAQALPEHDFRRPTYQLFGRRWRAARDAVKPGATEPAGPSPTGAQATAASPPQTGADPKPAAADKSATPAPAAAKPATDPKSADTKAADSKPGDKAAAKPKTP